MKKIFESFNINLTENQLYMFKKYSELLKFYNNMFNITTITDDREIAVKHFIDSIIYVDKIDCGKLIDIGSGGGFPAIPIKIMKDDLYVDMVEATGKKCKFLETIIKELDLKNINVLNERAETLSKKLQYRENYDICTARAVARMNSLSEYCLPFVKVGGKFIAYKTTVDEELEEAKSAIKILGGNVKEVIKYKLEEADRSLVIINKIEKTPSKYPRGNGKERKSPL